MSFLAMFLMLLGPFVVVGAIAALAQAAGGPVFIPVRMPRLVLTVRVPPQRRVAW